MKARIRVLQIFNPLSIKPLTWFSLIIRIVTSSKWNHNAIEVTTETGEKFILESIGKGVIYTPYAKWLKKGSRTVLPLYVPNSQIELSVIESMTGKPYGFWDIARIAKYIIQTRWLGHTKSWHSKAYQNKGYICSEVVCELLGLNTKKLWLPGDFVYLPNVVIGQEFST